MENETHFATPIAEQMKAKDIDVEKLAEISGVSERFITLILEEKIEKLPAAPYIHGYLVKIAEVLKLDAEGLWEEFSKYHENMKRSGTDDRLPNNRFIKKRAWKKLLIIPAILIPATIVITTRLVVLHNPGITFENLEEGVTIVEEETLVLRGSIDTAYALWVDDEQVFVDEGGVFSHELLLREGLNTITVKAKRPLGKENITAKQIFYEKKNAPLIITPKREDKKSTSTKSETNE